MEGKQQEFRSVIKTIIGIIFIAECALAIAYGWYFGIESGGVLLFATTSVYVAIAALCLIIKMFGLIINVHVTVSVTYMINVFAYISTLVIIIFANELKIANWVLITIACDLGCKIAAYVFIQLAIH